MTQLARLASRAVLRLAGRDTVKFLQGMVTNDVNLLKGGGASSSSPMLYAALLTPQGRYMQDLFLVRGDDAHAADAPQQQQQQAASTEEVSAVLADVDASAAGDIVAHLTKYRLRAKVGIENVSGDFAVWTRFGAEAESSCTEKNFWWLDPRLAQLGLRGMFPATACAQYAVSSSYATQRLYDHAYTGNCGLDTHCVGTRSPYQHVCVSAPTAAAADLVEESDYWRLRYTHGVGEGSEMPSGEALPLECNLDALGAVSYSKGCYLGQELTARTYHRGLVRKRLMPVQLVGGDAKAGDEVVVSTTQKKAGKVYAANGGRGLALLRLEYALPAALGQSDFDLVTRDGVRLLPHVPSWWPLTWQQERPVGFQTAQEMIS
eukprot:jgi/Chlat1/7793/Chrsp66S07249